MPSLTIKNIPSDLYNVLRQVAEIHRRSLNSEVIVCLEKALLHKKISPEQRLQNAKALRSTITQKVSSAEISKAINEGRP
ncbi:MAG: Arc family DNA-binding protein [Chitinivibrionales bacterium]|nr:Arc family DNA-binding protein [Chitinivibrionales bacterium]